MVAYDEFGRFHENAAEYGIEYSGPPTVRRESVALPSGLRLSALVWGTAEPELVLIHGGAQNAHTWDTVALALGRPLVAVDLPGHGYSDHRPAHNYGPSCMADDVAVAVEALAPRAEAVVGMSLGGLTAICLAADHSNLVRRLGVVDVTPGTDHKKAEPIIAFIDGPEYFDSFETILERTIEHNPTRSEASLRRGVLHNAHETLDGRWTWNYDRTRDWQAGGGAELDLEGLWEKVSAISAPTALWQGGAWSVVDDADVDEWMRRLPGTVHEVVDGAGHSIQGDRPLELVALIEDLLARPAAG
ncbi:MAG: alpha/beta hydrolase [Acidimicrobiaceae bacterium]|nr:alpha/beta hydrolase [Acidimicrobiaceae bacterium]MXZ97846.1 alpha/beta hydrolase [Acidimicrobiaceae bacterium]MYE77329.1 alpha/beta hydrolase [Acidimicrobiaceae bacterium]MYE97239.1 alpha/beta hydrolase [Acidimicrobiaceae bacterium]MYH44959.1 alpha/beta hydrolase [Acidimicrobiaceae bacterium]